MGGQNPEPVPGRDFFVAPPLTSQQIEAAASEVLVQGAPSSECGVAVENSCRLKDQIRTAGFRGRRTGAPQPPSGRRG